MKDLRSRSILSFLVRLHGVIVLFAYFAFPTVATTLGRRGRYGGFPSGNVNLPDTQVGLPSPPPACSSRLYGSPPHGHCAEAINGIRRDWGSHTIPPISSNDIRIREFLGSRAIRRYPEYAAMVMPKTIRRFECAITVTMVRGGSWSDLATNRDVILSTIAIMQLCLVTATPRPTMNGGYQAIGGNNEVGVFVYDVRSEFAKRLDPDLGCLNDEVPDASAAALPRCGDKRSSTDKPAAGTDGGSGDGSSRSRQRIAPAPNTAATVCEAEPAACWNNGGCCEGYACAGKKPSVVDVLLGVARDAMPYLSWCVKKVLEGGMGNGVVSRRAGNVPQIASE